MRSADQMPVWIAILSISLVMFMKMAYMFDILLSGRIPWNTFITANSLFFVVTIYSQVHMHLHVYRHILHAER